MIRIAVDAMGSDQGSAMVVEAVRTFHEKYPEAQLYVVGEAQEIAPLEGLATLVPSTEVMGMEDGALDVMRRKQTSMLKAIDLVANGQCDGVVSAGSTGAFLTGATLKLKLIPGVQRAALMSPFPTMDGKGVIILDIGANNENRPEHLVQFAKMGAVFATKIRHIEQPAIYLLSNGAEAKKGSPVGKEAHALLLAAEPTLFRGNMEAREVLSGQADVVVCEGYPGNVLLKGMEGTAQMMNHLLKQAFQQSIFTKIGYLFAKKGLAGMKEQLDYRKYGGAMLLGVNGVVVKGHGSSNPYAFFNAMRLTYEMIEAGVVPAMKEAMSHESTD